MLKYGGKEVFAIKINIFTQFIKNDSWKYVVGIILLFTINALLLAMPKLIGDSINSIAYRDGQLSRYIMFMLGIVLVIMVLKYFSRHLVLGSIRKLEYYLRKMIFDKALYIKTNYYEKNGPGKVMALMTNDVMSIRLALGLGIMLFVDAIFFGIFSFIIMGQEISYSRTIITLLPMLPIIATTLYFTGKMRKTQREAQTSFSDMTEFVQELFLGMHVIRAFNREFKTLQEFKKINRHNYAKNMKVALLDSVIAPLTYIAPFSCMALNIYFCGKLILAGEISVGEFVAMNGYLMLIIGPLMGLGSLASLTQKGLASVDRISAFMQLPDEIVGEDKKVLPCGDIQFKNLSFRYAETDYDVLSGITCFIPKGAFVGIVGRPGSGKSTIFKLLLGLQEVPNNSIFIDKQDINNIPLEVLRRSIAYVPQVSYIHNTTVQDNISFGEENKHSLELDEAVRRAKINFDLGEKIKGENSKLKEGGKNLSGGQKQRVNLARGFYKNANFLLLDDVFSALDFETASYILNSLKRVEEQTIILASQRLEVLRNADLILVLQDGKLVESGTHEELIAHSGEYFQLYTQQMEGGDISA